MPIPIREQDLALLLEIETTHGVTPAMTGSDVIYVTEATWKKGEKLVERDFRTQARPLDVTQQATQEWWEFTSEMPYSYSGTAGTPSALEKVLLMCGATSTVSPGTSVAYARESGSDHDSASLQWRTPTADGAEDYIRVCSGARGQLGFKIKPGEDIVFTLSGKGNYEEPETGAVIVPDFGTQRTNLFGAAKASNVTLKTLAGHAICIDSLDAENFFGFDAEYEETLCEAGCKLRDSKPAGTLKVRFAMPDWDSEFNPYNLANRNSVATVAFALSLGTVAGRKLDINVAEVQAGEPSEVILDNKTRGMELTLQIVHNPTITEK